MKLILKEYLANLRERDELDAILPDLLSELGFTVLSTPARGTKQHGVDVAAVGALDGGSKKLWLFSVKAGNLTRNEWCAGSPQNLQPSLDEIQNSYLTSSRVPARYRHLEVSICICIGGVVREAVRADVEGYIARHSRNRLSFEVWNGDFLAELVLNAFLREELLPKNVQMHLRKAVALVEEPDAAFRHFDKLMQSLLERAGVIRTRKITALRQINIALWVLYAWCRGGENVKAALLGSERALLLAWRAAKGDLDSAAKGSKQLVGLAHEILTLHWRISAHYLEERIFPHAASLYAVSAAVRPGASIDVNLQLFNLLGQIALAGLWRVHLRSRIGDDNLDGITEAKASINLYAEKLCDLINANPALLSPVSEDQTIDISLAAMFLAAAGRQRFLGDWLSEIVDRSAFSFATHGAYPCVHGDYRGLAHHPKAQDEEYFKTATSGSILFPTIALWAGLLRHPALFEKVRQLRAEHLPHSTFQLWFPGEDSEDAFYVDEDGHGGSFDTINLDAGPDAFLDELCAECEANEAFEGLSAVKAGIWPIILTACRHYRTPPPVNFVIEPYRQQKTRGEKQCAEAEVGSPQPQAV